MERDFIQEIVSGWDNHPIVVSAEFSTDPGKCPQCNSEGTKLVIKIDLVGDDAFIIKSTYLLWCNCSYREIVDVYEEGIPKFHIDGDKGNYIECPISGQKAFEFLTKGMPIAKTSFKGGITKEVSL